MDYLPAINLDLQEHGLASHLVASRDEFAPSGENYIRLMLGEIMMVIEQHDDIIAMTKYRVKKPTKRQVRDKTIEWEQYWNRSYELCDPQNFEHAMNLIHKWAGENAATKTDLADN